MAQGARHPVVLHPVYHDLSQALRSIPPKVDLHQRAIPVRRPHALQQASSFSDPVAQTLAGPSVSTSAGMNFLGVGQGLGTYSVGVAPPDPNLSVGSTQVVQWVNTSFAVFDKTTGALLYGPAAGNTLWANTGGGACEQNNDGDPVVLYDKAANRWVMTQLAVTTGPPYYQCIAISTTPDATGTFYRYIYQMPNFNDYPKLGVWNDAYYMSFNMFQDNIFFSTFQGAFPCALDRNAMLAGQSALIVCVQLSSTYSSLLPADLDGSTPPAAGSPGLFLSLGSNALQLWRFHADFVNTGNTQLIGPLNLPVASFSQACGGGTCIQQLGTSQQLDSLGDRLMYRLAYRNFGDHESLVANHSVTAGNSVGVRWYEIRSPYSSPAVFQQGTYAPDASYRWMGSIGMDQAGDIAVGYSVSSSAMNPSINYTGRVPGDPAGTLEGEAAIINGTGSQNGGLSRWGDYTAISIDPADDCTFWYTNEYLQSDGSFNWSTRVAAFKFSSCGNPGPPSAPSNLTASPGNAQVSLQWTGSTGATSYNVKRSTTSGSNYAVVGTPAITSFTDTNLTNGLTYYYVVSAVNSLGESSNSTQASATPLAPQPDFSVAAPAFKVSRGTSGRDTVTITAVNGFNSPVSLSVKGLPAHSTATFSPNPVSITSSTATSTLTVSTSRNTPKGNFTLTITGSGGGITHSTSATLTVN